MTLNAEVIVVGAGSPGLRVADASVFPRITSGNTNAPACMVGERAADFVLAEQA